MSTQHPVHLDSLFEYYRSFLNSELSKQDSEIFVSNISHVPIQGFGGMVDIVLHYTWRSECTLLMYPLHEEKLYSEATIHEFMNNTIVSDMNKNVKHFLPFILSLCPCTTIQNRRQPNVQAWISYSDDQDVSIVIKKKKSRSSSGLGRKSTTRTFRFNRDEFVEAYSSKNREYFTQIFKFCYPQGELVMQSSLRSKGAAPVRARSIYSLF